MRKCLTWLATAILLGAVAGCTAPKSAGPSSQAVWKDTLSAQAYQEWKTAPGYQTKQPAKGPHGKAVEIYVNPVVEETLAGSAATAWPTGSVIVKDALDEKDTLVSIEYMQKTDAGWYFASFKPDGTVVKEGVGVAPCQPCHSRGSDSVVSFKLPS